MLRIYLDNCCFNRPYDDQQNIKIRIEAEAKLFIQSEIKAGNIDLCWSYVLSYENAKNNEILKKMIIEQWRNLSTFIIEPNDEIDNVSEKLNTIGLSEIDALHLACAIYRNCGYFITTDKGILNKNHLINEITIVNPIDFVDIYLEDKNDN